MARPELALTPDPNVAFGQTRVDIAAPSTPEFIALDASGGTNATFNGTAAAIAFVAGAAALVLSTDLSQRGKPCRLADRILRNAAVIPALANANVASGRRLDLAAAVANTTSTPVRSCP